MKRVWIGLIGVAVVAVVGVRLAVAEPKGEEVTVKGEVIDLWCYLEGGDHGAEHKDCAVMCAQKGNPSGLLTEKGDIYVMMGIEDHQPGKDVLLKRMADTVTVSGTLVKKGGVQVIYVKTVK